jgi:WD40 repeat protein
MNIKQTTTAEAINSNINIVKDLPNEILQNICSRLDKIDIKNCKPVCKRFLDIVNQQEKTYFTSLLALKKHPELSIDYYKSVTRNWLQAINMPATEISSLDEKLNNDNFSLQLFFKTTKYIATKENISYEKKATLLHDLGSRIGYNECPVSCCLSPAANVIVSLSQNNAAKVWRLSDGDWSLEDTLNNYDGDEIACINNICFSPDGRFIVTTSNFSFKIWHYANDHWQANTRIKNLYANKLYFRPDSKRCVITTENNPKIYDLIDNKWQLVTDNILDIDKLNNIDPDTCSSTTPYIKNNTKIDHWLHAVLQIHIISAFNSSYLDQPFGDRIMTLLNGDWKSWSHPKCEPSGVNYAYTSFDMNLFMMSGRTGYLGEYTIMLQLQDNKWQEKARIEGLTRRACFSLDNKKVILYQEHIIKSSKRRNCIWDYDTEYKSIVYNITQNGLIETLDLEYADKIVFSADSKYIASSEYSTVNIWQEITNNQQSSEQQLTTSWKLITSIKNNEKVADINFSLDKRLLIIMLVNGKINICQLK